MTTEAARSAPEPGEYLPYFDKYISLVPAGDVLATLGRQLDATLGLLRGLSETQADSRYAPGKWSVKEAVGHMIDTERILAYRALRIARADRTPIPGYEPDDYVRNGAFDKSSIADLSDEFEHVRRANLSMFRRMDDAAWLRRGIASDAEVSVRALAYIIAGHELHHGRIIETKYLAGRADDEDRAGGRV